MNQAKKLKGISQAAREVGCAEATLRRLEVRKIVHPVRDSGGRRLFGDDDVAAARAHLATVPGRTEARIEGGIEADPTAGKNAGLG
jgi:hypothetical protein